MAVRKNEQGQYILKVGDVEKSYSEDELFQLAQKGFGAEAKFESANETLKAAETKAQQAVAQFSSEWANTLKAAKKGDVAAYSKVLDTMGMTPEEKSQEMAVYQEALRAATATPEEEEESVKPTAKPAAVQVPEEYKSAGNVFRVLRERGLSDDEIADTLMAANARKKSDNQNVAYQQLEATLDKDPVLGKILKSGGPKADWLRDEAREKLKGRILEQRRYDPNTQHDDVAKSLKRAVQEFGLPQTTPPPGLGVAPGIAHLTSHPEKPPEAASITSGDYAENVTQRLAALMASGE